MKIRERINYFLAKIAGEEVDLEDINPPVPINTTEKLLDKIAEEGVSSTLPAVTSDDDGDVLTVVDGEWAKAEAPSGGVLVVTATFDETTGAGTLDKTWQEIHDALPLAYLKMDSYYPIIAANESEGNYVCAVAFYDGGDEDWTATSPDDYPTLVVEGGGQE